MNKAAMQNDIEVMKQKAKQGLEKGRAGAETALRSLNDGVKSFTEGFNATKMTPFSGGRKKKKRKNLKKKSKSKKKTKRRKKKSKKKSKSKKKNKKT